MSEARNLVVMITHAPHDELASVGFTIACGGMTAGATVTVFLTAAGTEIVRKKASDLVEHKPLDPLTMLVNDFISRGGTVIACAPCLKARALEQDDLMDGVTISGAGPIHQLILDGAGTLSF